MEAKCHGKGEFSQSSTALVNPLLRQNFALPNLFEIRAQEELICDAKRGAMEFDA
jgi:hypothetical protein